jgi:hypothetical protein
VNRKLTKLKQTDLGIKWEKKQMPEKCMEFKLEELEYL